MTETTKAASLDRPTAIDAFGFAPFVDGVASIIAGAGAEELPFTMGIYGGWGSGKTSFLIQLRESLEKREKPLPTVWFEAWKYDRSQDVRSALIRNILLKLYELQSSSARAKIVHALARERAMLGAFFSKTRLGGPVGVPTIEELRKATASAESKLVTPVDEFVPAFEDAVAEFLKESKSSGGLVVFLDDLDRCIPENVIMILEALKLFLSSAHCVFVLGVDRTMIETAVRAHYRMDPAISGREYLDKIVQYHFTIPAPDAKALQNRYADMQAGGLDEKDWTVFDSAASSNPRLHLRVLAAWNLAVRLAQPGGIDLQDQMGRRLLLIATAINVLYPRLHEVCAEHPNLVTRFYSQCHSPTPEQADFFTRTAPEFKAFWDDPSVRGFFVRLRGPLSISSGDDPFDQKLDADVIRKVFRLSARTA